MAPRVCDACVRTASPLRASCEIFQVCFLLKGATASSNRWIFKQAHVSALHALHQAEGLEPGASSL